MNNQKKLCTANFTLLNFTASIITLLFCVAGIPLIGLGQGNQPDNSTETGKIWGKVIDATTKQPVEFATISIFSKLDSTLITGTVTDLKGDFVIEQIPAGT